MLLLLIRNSITSAQGQTPYELEPSGDAAAALLTDINRQAEKTDTPIILVARLGDGETLRLWNRRRLHNVAARLPSANSIIKTEGDKSKGKGRIEIYLKGQLLYTLLAHRNSDLAVDCCETFSDLYPWYHSQKNSYKNQAQTQPEGLTEGLSNIAYAVPASSEATGSLMAELNAKVRQSPHKLILISQLGDGEHKRSLHKLRLQAVESALFGQTREKWISTQGQAVKGLGRVDCYVDGVRELTLLTEQNEGFIMSCCELPDNDPRPARTMRKMKLRLAREKMRAKKLLKNNH